MLQTLLLPLEQFRNYCGPGKDREEWFSLRENHETACRFGLRNCETARPAADRGMSSCRSLFKKSEQWRFPSQQDAGWRIHYHLRLPQVGGLLLKNSSEFQQKRYASLQTAIVQELFHRFFRGRDSMKGNKENRR
jgi:hypothetical protein